MNLSVCCAVTTGRPVLSPSIHQISTLEKTKFYQRSILGSLISMRKQRVSPLYNAAQFAGSEEIDFRVWFSPGSLMQLRQARQESFRCIARPKVIIGFDFAVTLSSPESFLRSFRHHFRTVCRTEKMANVKQNTKDGSIHHV